MITIFLLVTALATVIGIGSGQATSIQISPSDNVVPVCTTFTINITINDVVDLYGFQISLSYDTAVMDAIEAFLYPPFDSWFFALPPEIDESAGAVHFLSRASTEPSFSGSGPLANVTFHCTAPSDNSLLHLYNTYLIDSSGSAISHNTIDGFVTQLQPPSPPINVTFRLLAVEGYYSNASIIDYNFETLGSVDFSMKSAQYFIQTLLSYDNWKNLTTPLRGFKYTAYVHLLSADPNANTLPYYRGPPTNSNVVSEIRNFLAATQSPWENNSLTIRIFYYVGHSGISITPPVGSMGFFLALGARGSHPANQSDPSNPSSYEELWDYQLNQILNHGDLANNNCTLIILDSCRSGSAIQMLRRSGRVILTACTAQQLAQGWISNPASWPSGTRDRWSWFTGQDAQNSFYSNGTRAGPLGIIGAITRRSDSNQNGWAEVGEIFPFANLTTYNYARKEGLTQIPQRNFGVLGGQIPLVQYNNQTAFPYNGKTCSGPIEVEPWPQQGYASGHYGISPSKGCWISELLWSKPNKQINASIVISRYEVIVATTNGSVSGLDPRTGDENWRFTAENPILSTPAVYNGTVYVATTFGGGAGGGVYAIDEATGLVRWLFQAPIDTGFFAPITVADGYVFAATYSETGAQCGIYVLNQTTGELVWSRYLDSPIKSSPAVSDGLVFVATTTEGGTPAYLHALNEFSGEKVWNYSFGLSNMISSPAVSMDQVIIGCMGGTGAPPGVYAFQKFTGTSLWNFVTPAPVSSSPAIDETNNIIIFGCKDGLTYALDLTGAPLWNSLTGPIDRSSAAISSDGLVYIGSENGYFYCLNETTGSKIWDYLTDGPIYSSPAISEGHVYIGTSNSSVYCFGPPFPEHDVAVKKIITAPTEVTPGELVNIECTFKNEGNVAENVTIIIGYWNANTPSFGSLTPLFTDNITLNANTEIKINYTWNTVGYSPTASPYQIGATVQVLYKEIDTADNILANGTLVILETEIHSIAVTNVESMKIVIGRGFILPINVTVENLGNVMETFDVTVYANTAPIETLQITLTGGASTIVTFEWNTTGWLKDNYTLWAYAWPVINETETADNNFTNGYVIVAMPGDLTGGTPNPWDFVPDGKVDITDVALTARLFGTYYPGSEYNPNCDIDFDLKIDIYDVAFIAREYGKTDP